MTPLTYPSILREAADELEAIRIRDGLGRELPSIVATHHATHLRNLAEILDEMAAADKSKDVMWAYTALTTPLQEGK